jgi:hypothetical protein
MIPLVAKGGRSVDTLEELENFVLRKLGIIAWILLRTVTFTGTFFDCVAHNTTSGRAKADI